MIETLFHGGVHLTLIGSVTLNLNGQVKLPVFFTKTKSFLISNGLDKPKFWLQNCEYLLTHQIKHLFWVLKRTVSLRQFF